MDASWRSMSVWKKSASVVTNESALIVTVLTCFSRASVALDCIVVGFLSFRGLREFLVVSALGLLLPLSRHDDVLHGCICSVALGTRRRAFCDCLV